MTFEDEIKQTLTRHEDDAGPTSAAFGAVEAKVRRYHRRRAVGLGALGVAALIAAAVVVPQLVRTTPDFAGDGGDGGDLGPPGVSGASFEFTSFRPPSDHYQLKYPRTWGVTWFEGNYELFPEDVAVPAEAPRPFSIEIQFQEDVIDWYPPNLTFEDTTIGGQPARRAEQIRGDVRRVYYHVDWTEPCGCPRADILIIVSGRDQMWDRYGLVSEAILSSFERADASWPSGPVHNGFGTVEDGVDWDEFTDTMARFLDARVRHMGADSWLTVAARDRYRELGYPDVHSFGTELWQSYQVLERRVVDEQHVAFTVAMIHQLGERPRPGAEHPGVLLETITVGPGVTIEDAETKYAVTDVTIEG